MQQIKTKEEMVKEYQKIDKDNPILACYTICKNEIKHLDNWMFYHSEENGYKYRVILDTGSTDGTWEKLQEYALTDKNLIIERKIFDPWIFNVARNYNLDMVPEDVDFCLSPDMDEFFTLNTIDEIKRIIKSNSDVHNISTDRMDIYSKTPRVGYPNNIPSNKIHRRNLYTWDQPIYEHLIFKERFNIQEIEIYTDSAYIIHNQDFRKKERPELYLKMLTEEVQKNPDNNWCRWYLLDYYFRNQDLENFLYHSLMFIKTHKDKNDKKFIEVYNFLKNWLNNPELSEVHKNEIILILDSLN